MVDDDAHVISMCVSTMSSSSPASLFMMVLSLHLIFFTRSNASLAVMRSPCFVIRPDCLVVAFSLICFDFLCFWYWTLGAVVCWSVPKYYVHLKSIFKHARDPSCLDLRQSVYFDYFFHPGVVLLFAYSTLSETTRRTLFVELESVRVSGLSAQLSIIMS
jgi:hypothetical protein